MARRVHDACVAHCTGIRSICGNTNCLVAASFYYTLVVEGMGLIYANISIRLTSFEGAFFIAFVANIAGYRNITCFFYAYCSLGGRYAPLFKRAYRRT